MIYSCFFFFKPLKLLAAFNLSFASSYISQTLKFGKTLIILWEFTSLLQFFPLSSIIVVNLLIPVVLNMIHILFIELQIQVSGSCFNISIYVWDGQPTFIMNKTMFDFQTHLFSHPSPLLAFSFLVNDTMILPAAEDKVLWVIFCPLLKNPFEEL